MLLRNAFYRVTKFYRNFLDFNNICQNSSILQSERFSRKGSIFSVSSISSVSSSKKLQVGQQSSSHNQKSHQSRSKSKDLEVNEGSSSSHRRSRSPSPVLSQGERRGVNPSSTTLSPTLNRSPSNITPNSLKPITKSASVPSNLKDKGKKKPDGILKRSTSFLACLARRKTPGNLTRSTSKDSLNSLSASKKCVSFSADTSFGEARPAKNKKTALHEAKVYKKGVLQGKRS